MKLWFDITNTPRVHFFVPIIRFTMRMGHKVIITSRDFAETKYLLNMYGFDHKVVGKYYEKPIIKKLYGAIKRVLSLYHMISDFDVALGSIDATHVAKLKFKKSIMFDDNDVSRLWNKFYIRFADYIIIPSAIPIEVFIKTGAKQEKMRQYSGFKEDVYIADFIPNPNFLSGLPFGDFITVRAESLQAMYVKEKKSLVPRLMKALNREGINILYLPRYENDRIYAKGIDSVFIPNEPLNGLDVCYHSKAVLTGAGTFAREAACIGTPAVSFFPGKQLLSVDQKMVEDGWIFHSRDVEEIVDYALSMKKRKPDLDRSKRVQKEVFNIVNEILDGIEKKNG